MQGVADGLFLEGLGYSGQPERGGKFGRVSRVIWRGKEARVARLLEKERVHEERPFGRVKTGREPKPPARPRKGLLMPVLYRTHITDLSFPFPYLIWWGQDARSRQSGSQVSTTELRRSIMTALHPRLALNRLSPTLQTFSFSPGWRTTTLFHSPESKAMPPTMKRTLSLLSPSPLHGVHPRRALCLNGKHPNLMTGRDAFAPGIRVRQVCCTVWIKNKSQLLAQLLAFLLDRKSVV